MARSWNGGDESGRRTGLCPRPFLVWSFQGPTKEGKERKERKKKIDDAENAESTEVSSSKVEIRFFFCFGKSSITFLLRYGS